MRNKLKLLICCICISYVAVSRGMHLPMAHEKFNELAKIGTLSADRKTLTINIEDLNNYYRFQMIDDIIWDFVKNGVGKVLEYIPGYGYVSALAKVTYEGHRLYFQITREEWNKACDCGLLDAAFTNQYGDGCTLL